MLRKLVLSISLSLAIAASSADSAQAAIGEGLLPAHQQFGDMTSVSRVQFVYGGYNYCWYPNGWRGPGFYWCGYALQIGVGWGGGWGWRGWGGGYAPGWHGVAGWHGHAWRGGGFHGGARFHP